MRVYVALKGERCEGSRIIGIYSDMVQAKARIQWYIDTHSDYITWELESENLWTGGCDFLTISEYEVDHNENY